jgi:hypothetical protein
MHQGPSPFHRWNLRPPRTLDLTVGATEVMNGGVWRRHDQLPLHPVQPIPRGSASHWSARRKSLRPQSPRLCAQGHRPLEAVERPVPPLETAAEAIAALDAEFSWLRGAGGPSSRRPALAGVVQRNLPLRDVRVDVQGRNHNSRSCAVCARLACVVRCYYTGGGALRYSSEPTLLLSAGDPELSTAYGGVKKCLSL